MNIFDQQYLADEMLIRKGYDDSIACSRRNAHSRLNASGSKVTKRAASENSSNASGTKPTKVI